MVVADERHAERLVEAGDRLGDEDHGKPAFVVVVETPSFRKRS